DCHCRHIGTGCRDSAASGLALLLLSRRQDYRSCPTDAARFACYRCCVFCLPVDQGCCTDTLCYPPGYPLPLTADARHCKCTDAAAEQRRIAIAEWLND